MKKYLLGLLAFIFISSGLFAQCTPNDVFGSEPWGISPDTTTNFVSGEVEISYLQQIDLKIPSDAGAINPDFEGNPIDSIVLNSIVNLPPGLTLSCNSQSSSPCTYMGGSLGCAVISGLPSEAGEFTLVVSITAYTNLLGNPIPVPLTYDGYRINIEEPNSLIENKMFEFQLKQNAPNPAVDKTLISYNLPAASDVDFLIYDLVGKIIYSKTLHAKAGKNEFELNTAEFDQGIYIYSIKALNKIQSKRLLINR